MINRMMAKAVVGCALSAVVMGTVGCGSPTRPTLPQPASESVSTVHPLSGPGNNPCGDAEFTPQQFVGDWTEPGDTTVVTLGADGILTSHGHDGRRAGKWSYSPWEFTPAKSAMPADQADRCVLWLRWNGSGPADALVYLPLEVTGTSLQLSYIGRGNTVTWVHPKAGS
ncbi:hypothetical protein KIH27_04205 [Mycobacterium sp. M1]|uniref:Lipoprotein n=1 Tax=Mycolicibacter acidiphilus TaxID=2835306 RepID=A0ABS5RIL6_9MYCO|nr:hypothetical protein [Mycolicibacter acidiphilus]MBS9532789.1 hypothetical protein [Mycolicibacter acidiphilus]